MEERIISLKKRSISGLALGPMPGGCLLKVILYPETGEKPENALDPEVWEIPEGFYAVKKED